MIRPILRHPDPLLRRRCAPVGERLEEARGLAADLLDTMYDAPGRGLAAPQIGALLRLFVVDAGWREGPRAPQVFLDPRIVAASREVAAGVEACLSIPDEPRRVTRPSWVVLRWTDLEGNPREGRFEGAWAVCVQHEADHLDGRLILDHGEPLDEEPLDGKPGG